MCIYITKIDNIFNILNIDTYRFPLMNMISLIC